ncbi:molybdopterin-guanine dinucleotide biosynthesis protein MobA [Massilia sp. Root351]|uniref:nucleotidyltransferase family protein n=1 Tax=Massilia sp. Root351 TaxID=1736522 RepID=UPI00070AE254|nr:nucleotidyltransferase family protein [Massilia sp. Root351]KQV79569.1 molybdopterin-guanine dinucleotide biosynthesis protein MobA [Massilia sp. Root351]
MGICGILLAAGRGKRFDPSGQRNKLLQSLGDEPVVVRSARHMLAALPRVVAVVRPSDAAGGDPVAARLLALGCEVTICQQADTGMAASLSHAVAHADKAFPDAQGWIVALGDMPHVRPSTIQSLKTALEQGAGIAAPMYRCQRGNPVGFSRHYLPQLLALEGDQGARGILKHSAVTELEVDDSGILQDIDTPADLPPKDKT